MKTRVSGFSYPGIIRIALLIFMLSTVINLFGVIDIIKRCPVDFNYTFKPLDGTYKIGSRFLFTYTISFIPSKVTTFDKQRTYRLSSEYFDSDKNYGSFRTVSSDVRNGQTFTYSQFPITGHLKIKSFEGPFFIDSPFFGVDVLGLAVNGDTDLSLTFGNISYQQSSSFTMQIPPRDNKYIQQSSSFSKRIHPGDNTFIVKVFRLRVYLPWIIGIALVILILYLIIKRIVHINRINT